LLDGVERCQLREPEAEKKSRFYSFGGPRNHDMLIRAKADLGADAVSVEAKADEPYVPVA
jgi:hypothetical protein